MKRQGNVWEEFCSVYNIELAIRKAAAGKKKYKSVSRIVENEDTLHAAAVALSELLKSGKFKPAPLVHKVIKTEYGKEREISKTPFYPDCCVHHAIQQVLGERWYKSLNLDTYACLKERGINSGDDRYCLNKKVKRVVCKYRNKTLFCLKMDISKCYPSVDNGLLAKEYRRLCKDRKMLELLDAFNFNHKGLPIGSYLSQLWINILLNRLDRHVKEMLKIKHYFRYMDDIVVFGTDKQQLHEWQWRIMNFLWYELHFAVNGKRQIFDVAKRGLDFAGYVYFKPYTALRKRIKKAFVRRRHNPKSVASYWGLLKHCDSRNLINEVLINDNRKMNISEMGVVIERQFEGDRIAIDAILGKKIRVLDFKMKASDKRPGTTFLLMQIGYEGKKRIVKGGYQYLCEALKRVSREELPFDATILNKNGYYFEGTIKMDDDYIEDYDD